MARILSLLLLVAGLGAAVWGAMTLARPGAASTEMAATAPMEMGSPAEEAPAEEMPAEAAPVPEIEPAPATPTPEPETGTASVPPAATRGLGDVLKSAEAEAEAAAEAAMREAMEAVKPQGTDAPAPGFDTSGAASVPAGPSREESFLQSLKTVPVAHEAPKTAEYKQAFDVTLAIDATGDTTAADALPNKGGVIETSEAKVSERVAVRLSGAAFDITSSSPEVQVLSPVTENVWRWNVTALSAGEHDLVFEVFAIDQDDVTPLRTFSDTVSVKVGSVGAAVAFADRVNPLFVLLGGIGSALAGLFGVARFFMGKK